MISIITTARQSDAALLRSIQSVRAMNCQYSWEHIITVAQPPSAPGLAVEYDSRTKVIPAKGLGISAGFNRAIDASSGQFLIVLNAGDELVNVNQLAAALMGSGADFIYGDIIYDGTLVEARNQVDLDAVLMHGMGFCHGAMLVRRQFYERFGLYSLDFKICMDMELMCRAMASGARGSKCAGVVARIEKAGVSGNIWLRSVENYRIIRRYRGVVFCCLMFAKWNVAARLLGA